MEEEEVKLYALIAFAIAIVLGVYLLGHAGANWLSTGANSITAVSQTEPGVLMSLKKTAMIEFIFGIVAVIAGVFVFLLFLRKKTPRGYDF